MATYWLETRLRDGTFVCKIPFKNLQFEVGFNGPTGIRWETPLYHPLTTQSNLSPGNHEVYVMRNGVIVAAGPLWDVTVSTDSKQLTCSAQTLEDYLDVRMVRDTNFLAVEQTAIAWGLIQQTQGFTGGDLGITLGTVTTGHVRSLSYKTYDNKYVLEAIQDIAELDDGYDFWITPSTRAFNAIGVPRPSTDRKLHLVYPQHISSYAIEYYGKYARNRVVVEGPDPNYAVGIDTVGLAAMGLREYGDALKDASNSNELTDYTNHLRDLRAGVKNYPTLVLRSQALNIFDSNIIQYGDLVKVTILDPPYVNIDTQYRYKGAQVTVNKSGDETIVMYTQDLREL